MSSHFRVKTNGLVGHKTELWYVDKDGNETDVSSAVSAIDVHIEVTEVNKIKITGIEGGSFMEGETEAEQVSGD